MSTTSVDTTTVRRWRRYPEYRPSGANWHPEVPASWRVQRIKFLARSNPSKTELSGIAENTQVSFVPMERVSEDGVLSLELTRPLGEVRQGFTYFRNGDVLVAKITPCFENGKGALADHLENGIGFGTTEFHVLRPRENIDGRYLELITRLHAFREQGVSEMSGSAGQQRVPEAFLSNYLAPLPSLPEQRAIAVFLDRETARIDALIGHKERLIELLEEKRHAVISHAVTRGLDPTAPLKDSGIDWIGRIPTHWQVKRLKHVCKLETGHTPKKSEESFWVPEDCVIPWISLNDTKTLDAEDFIDDTTVKISPIGMSNSAAHLVEQGVVVFNRDGARVGLSAITTKPMCLSQHMIGWHCGPSVYNYYLLHVIYAMSQEIYRLATGATIPTIGMPDVNSMVMPFPPLQEQREIAEHLVQERTRITSIILRTRNHIGLLREYRAALVSAAVTGQIDVRAEVTP